MTTFDLTDSIHGIHRRLVAQLEERRHLPHPTIKGDEGELLWLNVFSDHLPRRYGIRRGIVIDSEGGRSDAIDLSASFESGTTSFVAFLYSLLHRLQGLGTVPGVDWKKYRARVEAMEVCTP
jgi:hypothetical protein